MYNSIQYNNFSNFSIQYDSYCMNDITLVKEEALNGPCNYLKKFDEKYHIEQCCWQENDDQFTRKHWERPYFSVTGWQFYQNSVFRHKSPTFCHFLAIVTIV